MARSFSARLKARRGPRARRNLRGLGYTVDLPLPWEDEGADVESEDGGQSVDPGILFPGTGTEPNTPPPSGGTGNPSEVPLRPASYDFELEPPEYVIEPNDTMWGISLAWYGTGSRWQEIRAFQTKPAGTWGPNGKYVNANTTKFFPGSSAPGQAFAPGDVLLIPPLAAERIKARIANENPTTPASQGNAPGNDPTKPKGGSSGGKSKGVVYALAGGLAGAAFGGLPGAAVGGVIGFLAGS